jgi:hypothetical protein
MKKYLLIILVLGLAACGASDDKKSDKAKPSIPFRSIQTAETLASNDTISEAQSIDLWADVSGTIGEDDLQDFYSFTAEEGESFYIKLSPYNPDGIRIAVYDASGQLLEGYKEFLDNKLYRYLPAYSGTFYLEIIYLNGTYPDYSVSVEGGHAIDFDSSITCFEAFQANDPFYIVAVDKNRRYGEKPGHCPIDVYASKCEVELSYYTGLFMTLYFSQIYVDSLGGHREANRSECAFLNGDGYTTDYTIL